MKESRCDSMDRKHTRLANVVGKQLFSLMISS